MKVFREHRSIFPDHSTISYEKFLDDLSEDLRPGFQAANELTNHEKRIILIDRGIIALKLGKKEQAMADLQEAAFLGCNYKYISDIGYSNIDDDPEFFLRTLEKALNVTFMPFKDHGKVIEDLSQKEGLSSLEKYELMISYALLSEHEKALELYNHILEKDDQEPPEETAFLLAWLRNDLETAREEFKECLRSKDNLEVIINHFP